MQGNRQNLSSAFNPSTLAPVEHTRAQAHTLMETDAIHWSGGQSSTAPGECLSWHLDLATLVHSEELGSLTMSAKRNGITMFSPLGSLNRYRSSFHLTHFQQPLHFSMIFFTFIFHPYLLMVRVRAWSCLHVTKMHIVTDYTFLFHVSRFPIVSHEHSPWEKNSLRIHSYVKQY